MSFLIPFINHIKHESALNLYTLTRNDPPVPLPLADESGQISIRAGDCVALVGASGSGKSWTLSLLAEQVLRYTNSSVVYLDLDNRFNRPELVQQERFHLFQPTTPAQIYATILGLDHWLDKNADQHVMCVLVDDGNDALDARNSANLQQIQLRWGFALVTATLQEHRTRSTQIWRVIKDKDGHVLLMIGNTAHVVCDHRQEEEEETMSQV